MACVLLLWRRCKGSIKNSADLPLFSSGGVGAENLPGSAGDLTWGPWRVPEPLGTVVNVVACVYLFIVFFFTFWPPVTSVTPVTMNYSCLVVGFVALMSGVYYMLRARKIYKGPLVDAEIS